MKILHFKKSLSIAFFILMFLSNGWAQSGQKLWHNIPRELRYRPEGEDFLINNGTRRFNRALYGTNTAFRVEAGDLPEFALYLPGMGGNLKLGLVNGDISKWLINCTNIEARYRPGSMIYTIKDEMLGAGTLKIQVLAGSSAESMLVKATFTNTNKAVKLLWAYGGATGKKFSRDGDIGADPESSFYLKPDYCKDNEFQFNDQQFLLNFSGKSLTETDRYEIDHTGASNKTETVTKSRLYGVYPASTKVHTADANAQATPLGLFNSKAGDRPVITGLIEPQTGKELFWAIQNGKSLSAANIATLFNEAEASRRKLASRVTVKTPDPYINTLGGALSVAADGIWESPSYMHGAVAWRMRLPAWRGPYVADPLGWHDRAWSHFSSYALSQVTQPANGPVVADTALHIARQLEQMGTAMFSSGYIARNPGGGKMGPHHYDMNLVYIDELLNHFKWSGNLDEVKKLWPTIKLSLAWEKRNYDADGDGLYDAYCAIWASDALQYSGGGVTHSSAYNYRANRSAAYLAKLVGDDPLPYANEADKILKAINKSLWLPGSGSYAEYKDLLGLQLQHPSAGVWTVYHAIDSDVPDALQAYQSLRYVDTQIPHIPVVAKGLAGNNYVLATTNWLPYDWSLNNVVMAENLHIALAYWQGNRPQNAFELWKSTLLESMYLGASPGNFQQLSFYDAVRGELYRDFADPIGMAARSLVEGLFGVRPDLLKDTLTIKPGLPREWNYATLNVPDISIDLKRQGQTDIYTIVPAFNKQPVLNFQIAARALTVASLTVNGKSAKWTNIANAVGEPVLQLIAGKQKSYQIKIVWKGAVPAGALPEVDRIPGEQFAGDISSIKDPQKALRFPGPTERWAGVRAGNNWGHHTYFVKQKQGAFSWWQPVNINIVKPLEVIRDSIQTESTLNFKVKNNGVANNVTVVINPGLADAFKKDIQIAGKASASISVPARYLVPGSNHIRIINDHTITDTTLIHWHIATQQKLTTETVDLKPYFNDQVTNIFKNKYLSPRPMSPTLQLPWQGIGNWAYPLIMADIDDSGLKKQAAANNGRFMLSGQIPFATPAGSDKNILFTSRWDNYPAEANVPLSGNAVHLYLLMAGSTNPMQTRMVNATVTVTYTDGTLATLPIKNPENWWPIEQDDLTDGFAFDTGAPNPLRVYLKTGEVTDDQQKHISIKGYTNRGIDGGAANVLDLPLDKTKALKNLQLKTLTNDVIIGLMSVTLVRE